jgi:hypothetical protein
LLKADTYLGGNTELAENDMVTVELDMGGELNTEEEEAQLEAEAEGLAEGLGMDMG